jgi:hypothetical protein
MEMNAFLTPEEEAPLKTCVNCKDRPCIKTGKICDKVEALLEDTDVPCSNCYGSGCVFKEIGERQTYKECPVCEGEGVIRDKKPLLPKPRSGGHRKERVHSIDLLDNLPSTLKIDSRPSLYGTKKSGEGYKIPLNRKYD